jgi:peptidoglycan/LPS O-acetylase OafA/YrhL
MKGNNFNLIRLVLSLSVMFSHSFGLVGPHLWIESHVILKWGVGIGGLAVYSFFVISGYLITLSYLNTERLVVFCVHRILRLVPALVFALLFSHWAWVRYNGYAGNLIVEFNGSLWTLFWESLCYVSVGILGSLGVLTRRNFNIFFAALLLHYFAHIGEDGPDYRRLEPLFMFFAMGTFIALNEQYINMKRAALIGAAIAFFSFTPFIIDPLISGLQSIPVQYVYQLGGWRIHNTAYIFSAPFAIIYLGKYAKTLVNLRTDISYGVYIYAWPVSEIVIYQINKRGLHWTGDYVFWAALPIVLVLSYLSCKLIEEPALRLKRFLPHRNPQNAAVPG